jgi:spermidine synthase
LATIGFTSVVAQIVLMRELFVSSYGNELSLGLTLALWLFWTAFGSACLGHFTPASANAALARDSGLRRRAPATLLLAWLQAASAITLFAAILLVRSSRAWWSAMPGEVLGPVPILLTALVTLGVFCPLSGWLFAAGSRAYAEASIPPQQARTGSPANDDFPFAGAEQRRLPAAPDIAKGGSSTYLLEAAGSAVGGVAASIIFVRFLGSLQIAVIVAMVNIVVAASIATRRRRVHAAALLLAVVAGICAVPVTRDLELRYLSKSWPGFRVLAARNSRYGSLAMVETEGNRSVVQNGLVLFTVPDQAAAEEAVHFPLLEHPGPRSVLLLGGGLNGSLAEILRYPGVERIDYVELDPEVLRLARDYFPQAWEKFAADGRVHVHHADGRLFLKSAGQQFDVVVLNLPEPRTAQLNRFYTEQFFREVRERLAPDGVVGLQLHAAEEYISPELAQFLRCVDGTLRQVFPEVTAIPGETVHFLAAARSGILTADPQLLLSRLRQRGIQTTYIREYYLPFRMAPERMAELHEQLQGGAGARLNRDFAPIAYYFDVALWGSQFSGKYRDAFLAAASTRFHGIALGLGVLIAAITAVLASARRPALRAGNSAGFAVAISGLTLMGTEVLLLLGFQAIYGYVFDELAIIVAGFMAGMALGSWHSRRQEARPPADARDDAGDLRRLLGTQLAVGVLPLAVMAVLTGAGGLRGAALPALAHAGFPAMAIVCGFAGGYQFPIAMRMFSTARSGAASSAGMLYGLDLLGACFGALAITIYILPVFGFAGGAGLMALANAGPVILMAYTYSAFAPAP